MHTGVRQCVGSITPHARRVPAQRPPGSLERTALSASCPITSPTCVMSLAAWTADCTISPPVGGSIGRRTGSGAGGGGAAAVAFGLGAVLARGLAAGLGAALARGLAAAF